MKQNKKGTICFVIYIAGERIYLFIYEVIVKQNLKKRPAKKLLMCRSECILYR
jgi:hypothetical protein